MPKRVGEDFLALGKGENNDAAIGYVNSVISYMADEDKQQVTDGHHTFGELYQHRCMLFVALCNVLHDKRTLPTLEAWKSKKHHDGTGYDGWFIAGLTFGGEQITYHLPMGLWSKLNARELDRALLFDGHTSSDVVARLDKWFSV